MERCNKRYFSLSCNSQSLKPRRKRSMSMNYIKVNSLYLLEITQINSGQSHSVRLVRHRQTYMVNNVQRVLKNSIGIAFFGFRRNIVAFVIFLIELFNIVARNHTDAVNLRRKNIAKFAYYHKTPPTSNTTQL